MEFQSSTKREPAVDFQTDVIRNEQINPREGQLVLNLAAATRITFTVEAIAFFDMATDTLRTVRDQERA